MSTKNKHTNLIKTEAKRLGFLSCGISKAQFLEKEAPRLEKWLTNNMHAKMQYMENHFDKRLDPTDIPKELRPLMVAENSILIPDKTIAEYEFLNSLLSNLITLSLLYLSFIMNDSL